MILDKLTALSIARKALRENKSPDLIKARLLQSTYCQHPEFQSDTTRMQLLINKILVQAQQKENLE